MDNIFKTQEEIDILKTTLEMFNFKYRKVDIGYIYIDLNNRKDLEIISDFLNMNNFVWSTQLDYRPSLKFGMQLQYIVMIRYRAKEQIADNIYKTQSEIDILTTTLEMFEITFVCLVQKGINHMYIYTNKDLEIVKTFLDKNDYNYHINLLHEVECLVKYIIKE